MVNWLSDTFLLIFTYWELKHDLLFHQPCHISELLPYAVTCTCVYVFDMSLMFPQSQAYLINA